MKNEHVYFPERVRDNLIKAVTSELSLMEEALRFERAEGAQELHCIYTGKYWDALAQCANLAVTLMPDLGSNSSPCDLKEVTLSLWNLFSLVLK